MRPHHKPKQYGFEGRRFDAFFWKNGWRFQQLGIALHLWPFNVELHVPFGFFRFGHTCNPLEGRHRFFSWGTRRYDFEKPVWVGPRSHRIVMTRGDYEDDVHTAFQQGINYEKNCARADAERDAADAPLG